MKRLRDWLPGMSDVDQGMRVLREKMNSLRARAQDVREEVEHAEIQPGNKQRAEVRNWLSTVEWRITEFQNIEKKGQEQGSNSQLITCIERMTKEVQELIQEGSFPRGVLLYNHESTIVSLPVTKLVGGMFQINTEKIMRWLKNRLQFVFGVYGMGGVGKTTLLMHIHNLLLQDSSMFGRVYWITVSQNCSTYKLQDKIAEVVGLDLSGREDEMSRAAVLSNRLAKVGKKMVFILDDMWEASYVEDIGIPLGESGCKVILTTRSLEVCRRMGCGEFIFEVKTLARNEARNLFIDQLINYGQLSAEVKNIVNLVADECGCLPLAIITIGRCMRAFIDMFEWKNALEELRNPSRRQGDMEDKVLLKLKFSYDCLGHPLQDCFLSCVLYPEDYNIGRKELINDWMMQGLLDFAGSREEQLYKGQSILNTLVKSCLLESHTWDTDEECVKMHDLMRDMALFITRPRFMSKPSSGLKEIPKVEHWTEDLVKVSLGENEITEIGHDMSPPPRCPKLSVLMLSGNPLKRIPERFFVHMTALTVLDLSHTFIERLPESVSDLENLRVILLAGCRKLKFVPSLAKLTNLRVLDLPLFVEMKEPPRGMERLNCLEKISYCRWNQSEWTDFNRFIESWVLSTLYCYHFELHGGRNPVTRDPEFDLIYDYDRKMVIERAGFGVKTVTPLLLPRTIEMLSIIRCEIQGRRSLTDALPSLVGAPELKALEIIGCRGLEYVVLSETTQQVSCNFSQLEVLFLACLPDLLGVINIIGEGGDEFTICSSPFTQPATANFSHLRHMDIINCPKIKVVFQFKSLLHQQTPLPNLEYICVCDCEELEEIFEAPSSNNSDSSSNATSPIVTLPNLRTSELSFLPKLKSIYRGGGLLLCPSLEQLGIEDCPELEEMLPLSRPLICDASPSTLASIPTEKDNPHWWEPLHRDYPHDAHRLSDLVHRSQQQLMATDVPAVISHRQ